MITISRHAEKRMKERCGFNKKSIERIVKRAYEKGTDYKDTTGLLKRWIKKIHLKNKKANEYRVYGQMLYIFDNGKLVTVLHIPNELKKELKKN